MSWIKGQSKDNRIQSRHQGLDLSLVESGRLSTEGTSIKFLGGTTMGYDHATRGGIRIVSTRNSEYSRPLMLEDSITVLKESRRGVIYIESERTSGYPVTSLWGGGEDIAMQVNYTNDANNTGGLGARGLQVKISNDSVITNMYGFMCTVEVDNGATTSGNFEAGQFVTKNNGVHSGGTHHGLIVSDQSQGTFTGASLATLLYLEKHANSYGDDHDAAIYMINNSATSAKDITYGIYMKSGASGADFTYVLGFDSSDGKEGFTAVSSASQGGNIDGYIKIYDAQTAQALYIGCYDAAPA